MQARRRAARPVRGRRAGRVRAVVTADDRSGVETTTPCDTVDPRSRLCAARRAWPGWPATGARSRVVGGGRRRPDLPAAARPAGVVCRCIGTTVDDLEEAWDQRLQRARAAQARRAWPASGRARAAPACRTSGRGSRRATGRVPAPFTARPASRQITLGRGGGGRLHRRLPADAAPRRAPRARARGWTGSAAGGGRGTTATPSPSTGPSARASRSATSARSGKLVVSGPDVVEVLERLYPCHVADIKPGRSRYALLLNERGHVMDDGMILRESETRFVLTFTSGGAANAEMWVRDWIETWGLARPRPRPDDVASPRSTSPGRSPGSCCGAPAWPIRRASSATSTPRSPASRATSCACRSPARRPSSCTTRSTGRSSSGGR